MSKKIALVTGANRGLGLEISRQLATKEITVVMGCRNQDQGAAAVKLLKEEGHDVHLAILDVTNLLHIEETKNYIEENFGRLDILVNNAGIMIDGRTLASELELHELAQTLGTNLYGPLFLSKTFLPMMIAQDYGRIVNMSSILGSMTEMSNLNSQYEMVRSPAYRISKTSLNSLTTNLAMELRGRNVLINSCCPGWTKTDMGGPNAVKEIKDGADTPVWLATLPDGGSSGQFFRDRKVIPW